MNFDTLIMKAVTFELQEKIISASVQRVFEPAPNELIIDFYGRNGQQYLLFSIDSRYARIHLTRPVKKNKHNERKPSPFCMLLRKYLIGGKIAFLYNPPLERVLIMAFDPPAGLPPVKLIAEIMSRRSNLILTGENDTILGAARTASWEKNPLRAILPGETYRPVPEQDKLKPPGIKLNDLKIAIENGLRADNTPEKALYKSVDGISPLTARELLYRANWDTADFDGSTLNLLNEIENLFINADSGNLQPVILPSVNIYSAIPLNHLSQEEQITAESANLMLDRYYSSLINKESIKELRNQLFNKVERRINSLEKKRRELLKDFKSAEEAPLLRLYGELLLAYGHQVEKGASSAALPDLYNPEKMIIVPLNPSKNAAANARHYFNRYRKAKKGLDMVKIQLTKTKAELDYCQSLLYSIEEGNENSLAETKQELIDSGLLRERKKGFAKKVNEPQPMLFKSRSGKTILVGRNNRQNDFITFKSAVRRDTWLHARQLPGSHVILKESSYPPAAEDLEDAALLAAYFSKGRDSGAIEVDYTEVRHVRRRPGGKPGAVFYENYETITVNPRFELLEDRFNLHG